MWRDPPIIWCIRVGVLIMRTMPYKKNPQGHERNERVTNIITLKFCSKYIFILFVNAF
jgi:hypothetical protein